MKETKEKLENIIQLCKDIEENLQMIEEWLYDDNGNE